MDGSSSGSLADVEAYGYRIMQLHPKQLGLLLELDEVPEPDAWFWDGIEKQHPSDPQVDIVHLARAHRRPTRPPRPGCGASSSASRSRARRSSSGTVATTFVDGERAMISGIGLSAVPALRRDEHGARRRPLQT